LRSEERKAKCCGVSVTTVSKRRTKNKEKSEGGRLSARGKKRTRKSERNIFADEFDLHVVKKVTDFYFEKLFILRYRELF
jgi:hypothetical protein